MGAILGASQPFQKRVAPMPLTDTTIRNAKPAEKSRRLFDGGGLYLEISPRGASGGAGNIALEAKRNAYP